MSIPMFKTPLPLVDEQLVEAGYNPEESSEPDRCTSMKETRLHRDDVTIYVRCESTFGHPGENHRSWVRKWKTSEESGRLSL